MSLREEEMNIGPLNDTEITLTDGRTELWFESASGELTLNETYDQKFVSITLTEDQREQLAQKLTENICRMSGMVHFQDGTLGEFRLVAHESTR